MFVHQRQPLECSTISRSVVEEVTGPDIVLEPGRLTSEQTPPRRAHVVMTMGSLWTQCQRNEIAMTLMDLLTDPREDEDVRLATYMGLWDARWVARLGLMESVAFPSIPDLGEPIDLENIIDWKYIDAINLSLNYGKTSDLNEDEI